MQNKINIENIRNISVIAHVDHGKSTLTDSLIAATGLMSKENAGNARVMDTRTDEQQRGITIKSTGITLPYQWPEELKSLLTPKNDGVFEINVIDSPGHVDFSSEVSAALRVSDGCLVVVDVVEGPKVQTETVLGSAMRERVKPILAINKLDRAFLELEKGSEEIYKMICSSIEKINSLIEKHTWKEGEEEKEKEKEKEANWELNPIYGNVVFCSGKQCWGFTLPQFARIYKCKVQYLFGDWFFDHQAKKWRTNDENGRLKRGFNEFVLEPVMRMFQAANKMDVEMVTTLLKKSGLALTNEESEIEQSKDLIKAVMSKWLPCSSALFESICLCLPSPKDAAKYRTSVLYTGPQDDVFAQSMRECDPNGPLMIFISKHIPTKDNSRFVSFGRIFSGSVVCGQKVRLLGANYSSTSSSSESEEKQETNNNNPIDLFDDVVITGVLRMMGAKTNSVEKGTCGSTIGLLGLDKYISKSATVTEKTAKFPIKNMKYSVAPVVSVAVSSKGNPQDLSRALKKLVRTDPLIVISKEGQTGKYIISGAGELHLEIVLNDLQSDFISSKSEIVISEPVVNFTETVTTKSSQICLSKSQNKLNRLFARAEPLSEELIAALESKTVKIDKRALVTQFGWTDLEAKKVWIFEGTNVLVDMTHGSQNIVDIKDALQNAFKEICHRGVLCGEPLRGVRINIEDVVVHNDASHRGPTQIGNMALRCFTACLLTAKPVLLEPIFSVNISTPKSKIGSIYSLLNKRRSKVYQEGIEGSDHFVMAFLPVCESIGFNSALRQATGGEAFEQCTFDHLDFVPESKSKAFIDEIRKRKEMKAELPLLSDNIDKL